MNGSFRFFPTVTLEEIGRTELNMCLAAWEHRMGPVRRPFSGWSHALQEQAGGLKRSEAVELSRLRGPPRPQPRDAEAVASIHLSGTLERSRLPMGDLLSGYRDPHGQSLSFRRLDRLSKID